MAATPASISSSVSDSDRPIGSWLPGLTSGGARPPHQVCEAKSIQSCEGSLEPQLPVSYICDIRDDTCLLPYGIWKLNIPRNFCPTAYQAALLFFNQSTWPPGHLATWPPGAQETPVNIATAKILPPRSLLLNSVTEGNAKSPSNWQ